MISEVCINGRFLSQKITGVQRYARQMILALDDLIGSGELPDRLQGLKWSLVAPPNTTVDLNLSHIELNIVGLGKGHIWEQMFLPIAARGKALINFCNSAPIFASSNFVVIHDASVFRMPKSYSARYRYTHKVLGSILSKTANIITVSEFSKSELVSVLGIKPKNIAVIPNGSDHFNVKKNSDYIRSLHLIRGRYFLIIGSASKTKNLNFAIDAFKSADVGFMKLVIVGDRNDRIFSETSEADSGNSVHTGRISDAEVGALMSDAAALIFPSLYEGFGIPPLEAMLHGCPVIASDIPPCREVCADAAVYFNPTNKESLVEAMQKVSNDGYDRRSHVQNGFRRVSLFKWKRSAKLLTDYLDECFL